jgi:hypothetical protein
MIPAQALQEGLGLLLKDVKGVHEAYLSLQRSQYVCYPRVQSAQSPVWWILVLSFEKHNHPGCQ